MSNLPSATHHHTPAAVERIPPSDPPLNLASRGSFGSKSAAPLDGGLHGLDLQIARQALDGVTVEAKQGKKRVDRGAIPHRDRDEIRARADIGELAKLAGFKPGRYGKNWHCGFHSDRTPSASIRGGRIRCWGACGRSWDCFELIQQVYGLDFQGSLRWLADHYHVRLDAPLTDTERHHYARQRAAADSEAADLVAWRDGLLDTLRANRNVFLAAYHRAKNYILARGLESPLGNLAADAGDYYYDAYRRLDVAIDRIQGAPWPVLLDYYRRTRQAEAA